MPFAPHEIENKKFVVALRGYSKDEVDMFLRAVAADYRALSENVGKQPTLAAELPEEMSASIETIVRQAWEAAEEEKRRGEPEAAEPPVVDAPVAGPEPEPNPAGALDLDRPAEWRLHQLEKLVRDRGAKFAEYADEWAFTLFYLREHSDAEGRLPSSFDVLIEEVFGPLLGL
jgi:DivIVA domain-containing protein